MTHNSQEVETIQCLWLDERIDEIWSEIIQCSIIRPLERKEILAHATTGVNLEDVMLSEISQSLKDKYCRIPLT